MYVAMDENMMLWSSEFGWAADVESADLFTQQDTESMALPESTTSVEWVQLYDINQVQFPRLIAEAQMAGAFTDEVLADMAESMDLEQSEIADLLDRAIRSFDDFKGRVTGRRL